MKIPLRQFLLTLAVTLGFIGVWQRELLATVATRATQRPRHTVVMAALAGVKNIDLILAPCDLRVKTFTPPPGAPSWTAALYQRIQPALPR